MDTISKINSFRNLEKDWDGYGADKISETSITNAISFVQEVLETYEIPVYFVCPTYDSGVTIELRKGIHEAQIAFNPDGSNCVEILEEVTYLPEETIENSLSKILEFFA